jgi:cell wall-associated NlpC family hydrolase
MRCKFWIFILFLFAKMNVFSQEKYVQHIVAKGETVSKIAQQYNVKSVSIYELNPDAKKGIKFKEVLLIPVILAKSEKVDRLTSATTDKQGQHTVLGKETLYGIAKQYGAKVTDLFKLNPFLEKRGLRVGDVINIPVSESNENATVDVKPEIVKLEVQNTTVEVVSENNKEKDVVEEKDANGNLIKEVLAKETLYGIAKQYGVTVADIEKTNPILAIQSLRIGQKILIPTTKSQIEDVSGPVKEIQKDIKVVSEIKSTEAADNKEFNEENSVVEEVEITHEVLAKETKYGIAKEFGITVKELEAQNPKIVNRLLIGEKLTIRTAKSNVKTAVKNYFSEAALSNNQESTYNIKSFHGTDFVEQLISTASENIGVRYRSGGMTKDGFDCSGLMFNTFGAFDIQLPRSSFEQAQFGVKINSEEVKKGDLIFFKTNGRRQINHVGMVVEVAEDGEVKFIHASTSSGVIISSLKEEYYSKRVTQFNRVL